MLPRSRAVVSITSHPPILDFLAPSLIQPRRLLRQSQCRQLSTSPKQNADHSQTSNGIHNDTSNPRKSGSEGDSAQSSTPKPLTQAQRDFLSSALRVNQAGELAATLIYTSQTPPLVAAHPHLRPLMSHMYAQEAGHLRIFNSLMARHRIRPTAMYPIWTIAASALGWGTALMGREAAMACTEAVETEIGGHYNAQIRKLLEMAEEMKAEGEGQEMGTELEGLMEEIRRIRDEELEHLDHAVENDAKKAVPHELLTGVIRAGCKGAIWISERI